MVIVIAITAISSILFVYHDFQAFIRVYRYSLMILASFFGIIGVLFGFIITISNLCSVKSFGKPFMLPFKSVLGIKSNEEMKKRGLLVQNTYKGEI